MPASIEISIKLIVCLYMKPLGPELAEVGMRVLSESLPSNFRVPFTVPAKLVCSWAHPLQDLQHLKPPRTLVYVYSNRKMAANNWDVEALKMFASEDV
jgi:hypothetical protein